MTEEKKETEETEETPPARVKFYQSKKFLVFFLVWLATVALILGAMYSKQPGDVLRELIGSMGLALMTCSTAAVAAQGYQDVKG